VIHTAILDRALEVSWLDLALQLGRDGGADARARLEVELRDRIPAAEARKKTVRTLWRTWLEPPEPAREMIAWARERSPEIGDSRPLHLGALIATHPFFADICAAIGREAAQSEVIRVTAVHQRLRERWAARQSVDVAVRAAVRTLRSFGILVAGPRGRTATIVTRLDISDLLAGWLGQAVMLARGVGEIDLQVLRTAPELFMVTFPPAVSSGYRGVEVIAEGSRRTVLRSLETRRPEEPEQLLLAGEAPSAGQLARSLPRAP
jgi:hypothetical protein